MAELKSGDSADTTDLAFGTISVNLDAYDMNNDKIVDICDVVVLNDIIRKANESSGYDVNGDGTVDYDDTAAIRTYIISN